MHEAEALEDEAERLDIAVTGASADVERSACVLDSRVQLTRTELAERHEGQHEPVLGPERRFIVAVVRRQQPPRRCHPAGDDGELKRDRRVPPETQRHPRRRPPIAAGEEARVRLLASGGRGVQPPRPGGRVAEQLQVLDLKGSRTGRLR